MSEQWFDETPQEFADGFTETTAIHVRKAANSDALSSLADRLHVELVILLTCCELSNEQLRPARMALEQAEREVKRLVLACEQGTAYCALQQARQEG